MTSGSNHEPIYPPTEGYGYGQRELDDIPTVARVGGHSNDDADLTNGLRPIAAKYAGKEIPCVMEPGDVAFFPAGSHAVWTVSKYVRKVAFCRKILPAPIGALVRLARAAKRKLRPAPAGGSLMGAN